MVLAIENTLISPKYSPRNTLAMLTPLRLGVGRSGSWLKHGVTQRLGLSYQQYQTMVFYGLKTHQMRLKRSMQDSSNVPRWGQAGPTGWPRSSWQNQIWSSLKLETVQRAAETVLLKTMSCTVTPWVCCGWCWMPSRCKGDMARHSWTQRCQAEAESTE